MKTSSKFLVVLAAALLVLPAIVGAGVVFDETSSLTLTGDAGIGTDGAYGIIGFSAGSASADLTLTTGQAYKIIASRKVLNFNNNLSFSLALNGTGCMWDDAFGPVSDIFEQKTYQGYYRPSATTTTVMVYNGGPWFARLDYLSFDATSDVFFDEFSSPVFTGGAGLTPVSASGAITLNPGSNGMGFGGTDTVSSTVNLIVGAQYNVYARRTIHDSGNLGYDISLGGSFLAHDAAASGAANDGAAEGLIGQYTATSAATSVLLSNGGPWAARVDYLRFEYIPEPATIALLALGFAALRRRK
ncbi:MAG: PEP-CTERM sorting domain-containing protein [Sedimentisphaerales bacterium]